MIKFFFLVLITALIAIFAIGASASIVDTGPYFTTGSIPFTAPNGLLTQDNANLFFDDTNNRLGIGINVPTKSLDVLGIGQFSQGVTYKGSTSGTFSETAAAATTSYAVTWPAAQGAANTTLVNNGSGALSWGPAPLPNVEVSATANATTTSATDAVLITATPGAGTWLVIFSTYTNNTATNTTNTFSIYVNGVQKADSIRFYIPFSPGLGGTTLVLAVALNGIVTTTAGQTVAIQWHTNGGTATVAQRTLDLVRLQ